MARGGGLPSFSVSEKIDRYFLGHNSIAVFELYLDQPGAPIGAIRFQATGRMKRTGIEAKVTEGGSSIQELAGRLVADKQLAATATALDFKRFTLEGGSGGWTVRVELVGASQVVTAIPPARRYIRLYPDQRNALLGMFGALERVLEAS